MSQPDSIPEKKRPSSRRHPFRLLALCIGLLPVILVEGVIRWTGFQPRHHDAFAEFGGGVPTFVLEGQEYHTNPAREPYLPPQYFPANKDSKTRRIFCFGGSTVHGRPYQVDTAFPVWIQMELARRAPQYHWEVINCGGISYASYRIVPMVKEVMGYEPDMILVATGHNEFLEDRTYRAAKQRSGLLRGLDRMAIVRLARDRLKPAPKENGMELKTRLDQSSGYASYHRDSEWQTSVVSQFDRAIREISSTCRDSGIPVAFIRLGSNLRDCPPFKSEHRPTLAPEDERRWQEAFEQAARLAVPSPDAALKAYQEILSLDDEHALLHYRIARLLEDGDEAKALKHQVLAMDLDVCPLRMITPLADVLVAACLDEARPLVDAATAIAQRSGNGIPGFDWYLDHVHPNIAGHQLIARLVVDELASQGLVPTLSELPAEERSGLYSRHLAKLGPRYLANGRRRLEWLENWARREKLADEILPIDSDDHLRAGRRRLDFGDVTGALEAFRKAGSMDPTNAATRLASLLVQLEEQGLTGVADKIRTGLETPH